MPTQPYTVSEKLVISGQYLEFYDYEIPYWVGYPKLKPTKFRIVQRTPLKSQEEMRDDNVRRTRIKIRRLVNCNQDLVKFMTLTFAEEVFDLMEKRVRVGSPWPAMPSLQEYRDSKKPKPPPAPLSPYEIRDNDKIYRSVRAMIFQMSKEYPNDKEIRKQIKEIKTLEREQRVRKRTKKIRS